jgi:hypothetical protein
VGEPVHGAVKGRERVCSQRRGWSASLGWEKVMRTEHELTSDELNAVSGGAGVPIIQCSGDPLACAMASLVLGAITSAGAGSGGLVHEPIHAN